MIAKKKSAAKSAAKPVQPVSPVPLVNVAKPELAAAISTAIDKSTGAEVTKADANIAAVKTVAAMKADPILANATNQEPIVQSRIVVGGSLGVGASIFYLGWQVFTNGNDFDAYDWKDMALAASALSGAAFTLYGRLTPGLKPLFYGWFGRGIITTKE